MKKNGTTGTYRETDYRDYHEITYNTKAVGKRIRNLRACRGMSQMELADVLGICMQTLSYIESGKRDAKAEIIYRVSEYFGTSVDTIIGGSAGDDGIDKDLERIIKRLNYRQQNAIRIFLDEFVPEE